ncbi:M20 family metallopeptidase [Afifella sp. IM 167]|uniref:M20 family metallopeptidase n=1 Tax=Afifella sp. IM 167 TaxID=2033586 RepID=UPI001CCCBFE2|nr:M20 family metallopeptidase [Afifella sp. IM 167]
MLELLEKLVNIDSGSYDKAGIDAVGDVLRDFLESAGLECTVTPLEKHGDIIRATIPQSGAGNRNILLMGHRDTVFADGEAGRRPFKVENGRAYGPGVADMKSGLVMNSFVAAAFARFGGAPMPLVALFTGDEEIGSPASAPLIMQEASQARVVFNSEPGRANGNVVKARRGCIFVRIEVKGKAAHSGVNFEDGASAVEELAHKIVALRQLTDLERDMSVNVGLVSGGQSVNTTAPQATASLDIRYFNPDDRAPLMEAIEKIVAQTSVPGTSARMEIYGEFPPLYGSDDSEELLATYRAASQRLGIELDGELTKGAADSGFASAAGAATICGLGPVGGRYHSDEEYMEVDSMVARAKTLALAILSLDR